MTGNNMESVSKLDQIISSLPMTCSIAPRNTVFCLTSFCQLKRK